MARYLNLNRRRGAGLLILLLVLSASLVHADRLPRIADALARWSGEKKILLRSPAPDPLALPAVQTLLDEALAQGFEVTPAETTATAKQGLVVDLRLSGGETALILSRAEDGAIFTMDRVAKDLQAPSPSPDATSAAGTAPIAPVGPVAASPPASTLAQSPADRTHAASFSPSGQAIPGRPLGASQPQPLPPEPPGRFEPLLFDLAQPATRIAAINVADPSESGVILQFADRLELWALGKGALVLRSSYRPPLDAARPLYLGAADLDSDGQDEVVAVWGRDDRGIYQATRTEPHAWILELSGHQLVAATDDLNSYLRIVDNRLYLQRGGSDTAFSDGVRPVAFQNGRYQVGDEATPWGKRDLYAATPLDDEVAFAWNDQQRPLLVDRKTGQSLQGTTLLKDFGPDLGPTVAVPLPNPEYRSGWGKEDIIREKEMPLGRRVTLRQGDIFTIMRGRSSGAPLIGNTTGADRIVRLHPGGRDLAFSGAPASLEAFILDFSLLGTAGNTPKIFLLINEKENGRGKAYLAVAD